ncbi:MAG: alpha/beta hydrolase [Robiginitomaculum sp.]|nr:MAG: alpha/beta hydrolase [Robiginitomaculum sp.]
MIYKMRIFAVLFCVFCVFLMFGCAHVADQVEPVTVHVTAQVTTPMSTEDFEFVSEGNTLSGMLDQPTKDEAHALIIFIHGYGNTNVRDWWSFHDLRTRFAKLGIASLVWDKPGQGRSEGVFDINQPVESSAREVLDVVAVLRQRNVPGADRIGLWGISRAGWIAPIAMSQDPSIAFWISVSGVDDQESFGYMLESNLRIEGRSEEDVEMLLAEWGRGFEITNEGGSFEAYMAATENLRHDPFMLRFTGSPDRDAAKFKVEQTRFLTGELQVHPQTGLMIYVPGFEDMLRGLDLDVLALFGKKDTNVNWRKTKALYERTIGENPSATLRVKTFADGNHNIHQSETGGSQEMQAMQERIKSEGYYEAQIEWLAEHVLPK